jgi:ABC-type glycerol-3-phosphate transport system permease component
MELLASGTVIGWTVLAVVIWILIAFWPARVARRKGHSFLLFFIFSLFFFPAAVIVAYLVRDRTR